MHGETGLLSPEKDVDSLADSIKIFYNTNQNEYETYTINSNIYITKSYNTQNNTIEVKRIYEKL